MLYLQFFGSLDQLRRLDTGGEIETEFFTLGDEAGGVRVLDGSCTLGSGVGRGETLDGVSLVDDGEIVEDF